MNSLGNAKVTVASWEPRILVVDDFMTEAEADHMVKTVGGSKRLGSTAVVTTTGGAAVLANTVTSKIGTFPHADPVVRPPPPAATATKPSGHQTLRADSGASRRSTGSTTASRSSPSSRRTGASRSTYLLRTIMIPKWLF